MEHLDLISSLFGGIIGTIFGAAGTFLKLRKQLADAKNVEVDTQRKLKELDQVSLDKDLKELAVTEKKLEIQNKLRPELEAYQEAKKDRIKKNKLLYEVIASRQDGSSVRWAAISSLGIEADLFNEYVERACIVLRSENSSSITTFVETEVFHFLNDFNASVEVLNLPTIMQHCTTAVAHPLSTAPLSKIKMAFVQFKSQVPNEEWANCTKEIGELAIGKLLDI